MDQIESNLAYSAFISCCLKAFLPNTKIISIYLFSIHKLYIKFVKANRSSKKI